MKKIKAWAIINNKTGKIKATFNDKFLYAARSKKTIAHLVFDFERLAEITITILPAKKSKAKK